MCYKGFLRSICISKLDHLLCTYSELSQLDNFSFHSEATRATLTIRDSSLWSPPEGHLVSHPWVSLLETNLFLPCECCLCCCCCCCYVTSVVFNSVRPHRQQSTRLPHSWDSPGKNTGVGCHFLLQYMKVKSESEVAQSCPTLSYPMDCVQPTGSSIHGIFQARVLKSGAIAFSFLEL